MVPPGRIRIPIEFWEVLNDKRKELNTSFYKLLRRMYFKTYGPDPKIVKGCRVVKSRTIIPINDDEDFVTIPLRIRRSYADKLYDICFVEYDSTNRVVESLIAGYTPVVPSGEKGKFIPAHINEVPKLTNKDPNVFIIGRSRKEFQQYDDAIADMTSGKINWEIYKEAYIKRLQESDAQELIKELKRISEMRNVYIVHFEEYKEKCLTYVLIEYLNGGIKNENSI